MCRKTRQLLTFLLSFMLILSKIHVSAAEISEEPCNSTATVTSESADPAANASETENNIEPETVIDKSSNPESDIAPTEISTGTIEEKPESGDDLDNMEDEEVDVDVDVAVEVDLSAFNTQDDTTIDIVSPDDTAIDIVSQDDTAIDIVSQDDTVDESGLVCYSDEPEEAVIQTFGLENRYTVAPPTTFQEVHDRIMAFQEVEGYKEGTTWTNDEPYGEKGKWGIAYRFQGGKVLGAQSGRGCAAFAFEMSDAAFGDLPARTVTDFTYDMVRVGDILYQGTHFVIVTMISPGGVVVAEGNYNKSVHWGRVISAAVVESFPFIVTRYPEGFVSGDAEFYDKVVQSGTENGLDWTLTGGGTLTISGNGAIPDYTGGSISPPWNAYADSIGAIVIEKGVTSIGDYAFCDSKATMVCLPDGLTSIGECAFKNANITDITVPASVQVVGNSAFALCSGLVSAHFMSGSTRVTLGENLFTRCWELLYVTLPEHADCINGGMFGQCIQLPYLYIPKGIERIESINSQAGSPFMKTDKLTCIEFGGTAEEWNARGGNTALKYAGLNSSIMKFGIEFVDPFVPNDHYPDDLIADPSEPTDPPSPAPDEHEHEWDLSLWNCNDEYHWHECIADGCPVSDNSLKAGYAKHNFGEWVIDAEAAGSQDGSRHRDCQTCPYRQTEVIPATGDNGDDSSNIGDTDDSGQSDNTDSNGGNDSSPIESGKPGGTNIGGTSAGAGGNASKISSSITDPAVPPFNTGTSQSAGSSLTPPVPPHIQTQPNDEKPLLAFPADASTADSGNEDGKATVGQSGDEGEENASQSDDEDGVPDDISEQRAVSNDDSSLPPNDSFATAAVALLALSGAGGLGIYFRTPIRKLITTLLSSHKR